MSGFSIQISEETLKRANSQLSHIKKAYPLAVARAVNRTTDGMRTDAVNAAVERYYVKPTDVRKTITFRKATSAFMTGTMVSRGRRRSLKDYMLTPSRPTKGAKTEVQAAVKRKGGMKPLPRAFLVKRAGGKYFAFYREGYDPANPKRKGIRSYISPSIPQILNNKEIVEQINERAVDRFSKRLDHEVLYLLGQI